jgi:glycogen operon protein
VADRFLGSPEIYGHEQREAEQSVNFVTCHDGFTLRDLVSYNQKHNDANGEANRDGHNDNRSWNCGVEGPSDDPEVERLRVRQAKNLLTFTMLSLGMPMILMGDEVLRTQGGNNNAYCQDSEASWFDWSLLPKNAEMHRFVRLLIARRSRRDLEYERQRLSLSQLLHEATLTWHGVKLNRPDWSPNSHSVALGAELPGDGFRLHIIWNAWREALDFELPPPEGGMPWRRWIDTMLPPPGDIVEWRSAPPVSGAMYTAGPRSVVVLAASLELEGLASARP